MTRALWVAAEVPDTNGWGGPIRQAHLLRALATMADVDLVVGGDVVDPAVREAVASVSSVPVGPAATETRLRRRLHALGPARPVHVRDSTSARAALAAALPPLATYDVVVLVHGELAAMLPGTPSGRPRWIVDLHHLMSVRHRHEAAITTGRARVFHQLEARRALRFERQVSRRCNRLVVCSAEDAMVIGDAIVVPNGVAMPERRPTPVPSAPRVVFTGHLGYPPNVDAVRWLVTRVLPVLRRQVPGVTIDVVGRCPSPEVRALEVPGEVVVHADVVSVAEHLGRSRAAVVPVRVGSGTRLKALEAMAAGRPVVGTTIGLEGLGIRAGVHALVADEAVEMAVALARVLVDDALADRLAAAGFDLAGEFDWPKVARGFAEVALA